MTARTMALRLTRAQRRTERRDTLLGLLGRLDTLTAVEQALVVEYVHAELGASDELRRAVQGQQRALQAVIDQTRAAEATIVEVEQERDAALKELAAVRQYDRALIEASSWPNLPPWEPSLPRAISFNSRFCQTCPNAPAAEQHSTSTKEN
ncbi:hypothetical protein [Streptomyces zaomyceticus]|uniref:hypothetical protein n=1 Tax=Streptomyces zaomyceticus TaxID=68286 RepID=UPI00379A0B39